MEQQYSKDRVDLSSRKQTGNHEKRVEELLAVSLGLMAGEKARGLLDKYKDSIENITPSDMVKLEDRQMQMGIKPGEIKEYVNKVINVFFNSLAKYEWEKPKEGSFLYYLMLENQALQFKLDKVKALLKAYRGREHEELAGLCAKLLPLFQEFTAFESHHVKKENILFPYLERRWESPRPLKIMWSFDDDIRKKLKEVISILESKTPSWKVLARELGAYFFLVVGMIHKENLVVYPLAAETVPEEDWTQMQLQSFEYPFPFIEAPQRPKPKQEAVGGSPIQVSGTEGNMSFRSETGELSMEQVLLLFNNLPVDITFVDEENKVKFFSKPEDRFFPRSPAIIGRHVNNCHPPESVHVVEKIVDAFKEGKQDRARFWLELKGKFILIQYFALRDHKGVYKGVLEVSQDVSDIRGLEGEQRLLDWKSGTKSTEGKGGPENKKEPENRS